MPLRLLAAIVPTFALTTLLFGVGSTAAEGNPVVRYGTVTGVPADDEVAIRFPAVESARRVERPSVDLGPSLLDPIPSVEGKPAGPLLLPMPSVLPGSGESAFDCLGDAPVVDSCIDGPRWWDLCVLARGYYLNDQRVEWSGLEETFGAEAQIAPVIRRRFGAWDLSAEGDFYLNQRFDKNVLVDTKERGSYTANFESDVFEIWNLYLSASVGNWRFALGKFNTPFGRLYEPVYTNAHLDAPFIRTEAINWTETGLLIQNHRGLFRGDVALVNGSEDRDTNSSKALITRLGLESDWWGFGASLKTHDGTGSEGQKQYNNHVGGDFALRWGNQTLSGEVIYDEYGFRRPGYDPDEIFWGRNIYYRDLNRRFMVPLTGVGYYVNWQYYVGQWSGSLNYGEFRPTAIGHAKHDIVNRRGIIKIAFNFNEHFQVYSVTMLENGGYAAQDGRPRVGTFVLNGFQATF